MKRLFMLIAFVLGISMAHAQDYEVVDGYITKTKVFENTGLSVEETHQRMTLFFGSYFNDVNQTCRVDTPNKLLYKFLSDVAVIDKGWGTYHTYHAEYELEISIKDNRMRMVLKVYNVDSHDMIHSSGYNPVDAFPIATNHNSWDTGVSKKWAEKIYNGLMSNMTSIESDIEKALYTVEEEDEW